MNRRDFLRKGLKGTAAYSLLPATLLGSHAASAGRGSGRGSGRNNSTSDVDEEEIKHLNYMREEEKLARDVYLEMYDKWALNDFANIAESEQVHTDAVRAKIVKHNLDDPVIDDTVGAFVNKDLAVLYDTLIAQGNISELDALYVGCAIEEIDMIDLQDAIDNTDHADIIRTYENLMAGSRNHLRAYVSQLESRDITYSAQYLSQIQVDDILTDTSVVRRS